MGAKARATKPSPQASGQESARESNMDRLGREAYIQLYLASRLFTEQIEKLCKEEGLAMSHYIVLWFLSRRDEADGVPMGAVIDGHLNRASDATRLADRLAERGCIERLTSPGDRRVVRIRLTNAGREVFERLTANILSLHREQWKALDSDELAQLRRLLAKALAGDEASDRSSHPLVARTPRPA